LEYLMQAVKARKQGNALVVTIPSAIKVPEGTEFYVIWNEDQSITFIPKIENYYATASAANGALWQKDAWDTTAPAGREVI
jgi:antitoxin component of MazEF toxin-antitoxin module